VSTKKEALAEATALIDMLDQTWNWRPWARSTPHGFIGYAVADFAGWLLVVHRSGTPNLYTAAVEHQGRSNITSVVTLADTPLLVMRPVRPQEVLDALLALVRWQMGRASEQMENLRAALERQATL